MHYHPGSNYEDDFELKVAVCGPDPEVSPSAVSDRLKIVFVREGTVLIRQEGQKIIAGSPSLLLLNSMNDKEWEFTSKCDFRTLFFHPCEINDKIALPLKEQEKLSRTSTMVQDFYLLYPFMGGKPVLMSLHEPMVFSRVKSLFDAIVRRLQEKTSYWPCETRAILSELLFFCRRIFEQSAKEDPETLQGDDPLIDKALMILHSCYKEDLTLEQLALDLATNRTTLAARFKSVTGETVFGYLRSIRLRMAEHMVRETTLPMNTVMEHTGFNDPSHFGRAFTEQFGKPPAEYRKAVGRQF